MSLPTPVDAQRLIFDFIAEHCLVDKAELSLETSIDQVGLDSISVAQLLMKLEIELGLVLDDGRVQEILQATTIQGYLDALFR